MSLVYIGYVPHPPILIPEIGRGEERKAQATINGYQRVVEEIVKLQVETVVLVSPHAPLQEKGLVYLYGPTVQGDFRAFNLPGLHIQLKTDREVLKGIQEAFPEARPVLTPLDHGSLVPLYFLLEAGWKGKVVVLAMPLERAEQVGHQVSQILNDLEKPCAILASGDLSHKLKEDGPYGFDPAGPEADQLIVKALKKDPGMIRGIPGEMLEAAAQCGYHSLLFALGAREGFVKVLSYEGPFGVGYLVAEIYRSSSIAGYARECLTHYLKGQPSDKLMVPGDPLLKEKKSCFVTLKKDGQLRGCIGTVQPRRENLALEIKHNAISAGTQDPRFWPLQPEELPLISISVDVLGEMEKIQGSDKLDPQRYGVVVRNGGKVGLLLPHLEGIDTVEEQLQIAREKAGIYPEEEVELWRFEVERYFE